MYVMYMYVHVVLIHKHKSVHIVSKYKSTGYMYSTNK
jgi:hypothetical protein